MDRKIHTDAMSKVEVVTGDIEDFQTLASQVDQYWPSPEKVIPDLKKEMSAILEREGFPPAALPVFWKGNYWCERWEGERQRNVSVGFGWGYAKAASEPLTLAREAVDIYFRALVAEGTVAKGDTSETFAQAYLLGAAVDNFIKRRRFLRTVDRGSKVAGGMRNSAHQTNQRHVPLRASRFARMNELVPKRGVDAAAKTCEKEGLGDWRAIKQQWNRHRKSRDT